MNKERDVQEDKDERGIPLRVGIKNFRAKITVMDKTNETQMSDASINCFVDLKSTKRGTHMSRLGETINNHLYELNQNGIKSTLIDLMSKLDTTGARMHVKFSYGIPYQSPVKKIKSTKIYDVFFYGKIDKSNNYHFMIGVEVPVMTVCPCSLEMCKIAAHSQIAIIRVVVECDNKFVWIEDIIKAIEDVTNPVGPVLKRPDEKWRVLSAFENAQFVEDVVRDVKEKLDKTFPGMIRQISCESHESIHQHNAYAEADGTA